MYRIVTRQSKLALRQTQMVVDAITRVWPDFSYQILPMKTMMDDTEIPISLNGGKVSFVKELEEAVLSGFADLAVHSLKDMACKLQDGLVIPAFLPRIEPRDALLTEEFSGLSSLPQGAIVGTSSLRRASQLLSIRPDLQVVPCRGNVDTRIQKLKRGDFSALVLAGAGLERLNLSHLVGEYLSTDQILPACGQGVIALECRRSDAILLEKLALIHDHSTGRSCYAERKVVEILGGHCQLPLGVFAKEIEGKLLVRVCLGHVDGTQMVYESCYLDKNSMERDNVVLEAMCQRLLESGGAEILHAYT
ncbi:MAG: hydroxymethylbilane synthase [Pseudomonadota bacterium]|nr:hydroxymethylbilane synthase [Pseudomonadota bacterium]